MAATFNDIIKQIETTVNRLNRSLPATEKALYDEIAIELKRLDTSNGKIKTTVKNLSIVDSIQKKLNRIILNPDYVKDVKEYAKGYNEVTKMQNDYWKNLESTFKPKALLKAIRTQTIENTVKGLTGAGIGEKIAGPINQILRTNITAGGSYADLTDQLRDLIKSGKTPGILDKNLKQVALDSLNQYSAQYNQIVSSDLGFQWFSWQGSEVHFSRPFCQALAERHRYFHISGIPNLLKGLDEDGNRLRYTDNITNEEKEVTLYSVTDLPYGFIAGTTPENFLIRRGGYNCGHQPRPVSEDLVQYQDEALYNRIINSGAYKAWLSATTGKPIPKPEKAKPEAPDKPVAKFKPEPETVLEARQEPDNKKVPKVVVNLEASDKLKNYFGSYKEQVLNDDRIIKNEPQVTVDEKTALFGYTRSHYRKLNEYNRGETSYLNEDEKSILKEYTKLVNNALEKMSESYSGVTYRGVTLRPDQLEKYIPGKTYTDPAFVSSSYNPGKKFSGNTHIKITGNSGKYVRKLGGYEDDEAEVLYKAGTKFNVINKYEEDGITYIELEEAF